MVNLILTIIVGFIGGITALRLKIPAGAMVGSMIAVGAFSIITGRAFMPQNVKIITQISAGAFIGAGISRKDVLNLKLVVKPAILMVLSMILLNLFLGYIMHKVTGIDLVTCLFASAPAGVVDMSLISSDMGADTSKVAVLQMVRLLVVFTIVPSMMKFIHLKLYPSKTQEISLEKRVSVKEFDVNEKTNKYKKAVKEKAINLSLTLGIALISGLVGYKFKIPAGAMTFAMISVGALTIFYDKGYMPINLRRGTQVFAGILIGASVTYDDLIALKEVIIPAFILLIGIIIFNLLVGFFISKISGMELITALLASAPGGISDMALIAQDLGGDGPKITIMQLSRYICIIAIFPIIIKYITSLP